MQRECNIKSSVFKNVKLIILFIVMLSCFTLYETSAILFMEYAKAGLDCLFLWCDIIYCDQATILYYLFGFRETQWMPDLQKWFRFFFLSRCWVGNILWDLLTSLLFRLWKWCFTARRLFFNQGLRRVPWRVLEPFMVEHGVDAAWYNQSPSVIQCPGSLVTALGLKAAHKVCEHSAIYLSLWACARTHLTFSISSAWQIVPP